MSTIRIVTFFYFLKSKKGIISIKISAGTSKGNFVLSGWKNQFTIAFLLLLIISAVFFSFTYFKKNLLYKSTCQTRLKAGLILLKHQKLVFSFRCFGQRIDSFRLNAISTKALVCEKLFCLREYLPVLIKQLRKTCVNRPGRNIVTTLSVHLCKVK